MEGRHIIDWSNYLPILHPGKTKSAAIEAELAAERQKTARLQGDLVSSQALVDEMEALMEMTKSHCEGKLFICLFST